MGAECSVPCAVNNRFSAETTEPREKDVGRAGKDGKNWFERKGRSGNAARRFPLPQGEAVSCAGPSIRMGSRGVLLARPLTRSAMCSKRGHTRVMEHTDIYGSIDSEPSAPVTNPTPVKIGALDFVSESLKVCGPSRQPLSCSNGWHVGRVEFAKRLVRLAKRDTEAGSVLKSRTCSHKIIVRPEHSGLQAKEAAARLHVQNCRSHSNAMLIPVRGGADGNEPFSHDHAQGHRNILTAKHAKGGKRADV